MKLKKIALEIRQEILKVANKSKCSHIGSCFSYVDILTVLYYKILRLDDWENRDLFILSKGHAALSFYTMLYFKKIIDKKTLYSYYQDNGILPSHLDKFTVKGVEVSTGSLGHGFNIGLGLAYGFKKKNIDRNIYVLLGDGEVQEGSIWEGAMFASKLKINNFTAIIDYNNLQGYGRAKEICSFESIEDKWKSFGWDVIQIDGHDFKQIEQALLYKNKEKPKIIIAKTIKGKGVSFMEDELIWHYYIVTDEIYKKAILELK